MFSKKDGSSYISGDETGKFNLISSSLISLIVNSLIISKMLLFFWGKPCQNFIFYDK